MICPHRSAPLALETRTNAVQLPRTNVHATSTDLSRLICNGFVLAAAGLVPFFWDAPSTTPGAISSATSASASKVTGRRLGTIGTSGGDSGSGSGKRRLGHGGSHNGKDPTKAPTKAPVGGGGPKAPTKARLLSLAPDSYRTPWPQMCADISVCGDNGPAESCNRYH